MDISSNKLTTINVDSLTSLMDISCDSNEFISLNFSNNPALTSLTCTDNALTGLIVKNGNNNELLTFDATGNPDLLCIEINDVASIGVNWQKDTTASFSENCHYNETYIPDDAFEQALIDLGYDYSSAGPLDDYVPTARINTITTLNIRNNDIIDLTGIQDFVELVSLNCSNNRLTNLDFGNNPKLKFLNCSGNQLANLNVSFNASLINLDVSGNSLTDIDVNMNTILFNLNCSSNQLTSLDITKNINLDEVYGQFNQLFSVNANNGFNLILSKFDLSNNPNLTCILVDDITASEGFINWFKDKEAQYRLECNDDDNDGIVDDEDNCPATTFGDPVDLFGCSVFNLSVDNFNILITGETCRSANNGKVNIAATKTYNYTAHLQGNEWSKSHDFTNTLEMRNVRAGTYTLCLTIESEPGYEQCFTLVITEPKDLVVLPLEGMSSGRIAYKMSGASIFIINFNGLVFETTDNNISFMLEQGRNTIKIKTKADCQGAFEETIFLSEETLLFPNPFKNYIDVVPSDDLSGEMQVIIFSISGKLVSTAKYNGHSGVIHLDTSSMTKGVYIIELIGKTQQNTFKIVKK